MAAEMSRSSSSADTYIGSLISLTSKSEMRYEGVLYNINTDESSIGLRNVRSFGTEGRKKDGPQVPPIDKVYDYILFRGSDIKDLQVKASPTVQPASPPLNNDPAIIQSHYSRPESTTPNLPSTIIPSLTDLNSHTSQGSSFQSGLPLYQPGGNLGQWGPHPPPPSTSGNGLAMPMYWQGYYGPSPNGLPNLQQQPLLRPGLSMPPLMQQPLQYPAGTSNLAVPNSQEYTHPPSLVPPIIGSLNLTSSFPSTLPPFPSLTLSPETLPSTIPNKTVSSLPPVTLNANLLVVPPSSEEANAVLPPISSNRSIATSSSDFPYHSVSQSTTSIGSASTSQVETQAPAPIPSLITPGQFLQSEPIAVSSAKSLQAAHKDMEAVLVSSPSSSHVQPGPASTESQPPILPLPEQPSRAFQKFNGAPHHNNRSNYRGRERGRGPGSSRPITKFTEDFDFMAMNEKFNKDEVWGHLGKHNNKSHHNEGDENGSDEDDYEDVEHDSELKKFENNAVYNKDDFFDSLSSNALDRESNNGRSRFTEQMKLDTETFGEFPRYHRGGRGYGRGGGGRSRGGGYYGRGGYGYNGRGGRGRGIHNPNPNPNRG
ncbi:protein decapping 5-like [Impatiens glandulifera]|uniref:protein decapping 5-like n=1 Tax=Impatiens glandulifera TaxID=253017 RepID=UPI001FB0746C|nr:protein decapping 5-like [Impatiens glandulifera]